VKRRHAIVGMILSLALGALIVTLGHLGVFGELPRSAAVSVGWYMMVPPLSHTASFEADYRAPLSAWPIMRAFDSAEACEDYRSHEIERYKASSTTVPTNVPQAVLNAILFSQCVASDDPRLKYYPT
jgi:hypothetical protein